MRRGKPPAGRFAHRSCWRLSGYCGRRLRDRRSRGLRLPRFRRRGGALPVPDHEKVNRGLFKELSETDGNRVDLATERYVPLPVVVEAPFVSDCCKPLLDAEHLARCARIGLRHRRSTPRLTQGRNRPWLPCYGRRQVFSISRPMRHGELGRPLTEGVQSS